MEACFAPVSPGRLPAAPPTVFAATPVSLLIVESSQSGICTSGQASDRESSASITIPVQRSGEASSQPALFPIDGPLKSSPLATDGSSAPQTIASSSRGTGTLLPLTCGPGWDLSLPPVVPVQCQTCRTVFTKARSALWRVKPGMPLSCSHSCRNAKSRLTLTCEGCGTAYTKRRGDVEAAKRAGFTRNFCTKACYRDSQTAAANQRVTILAGEGPSLTAAELVTADTVRTETGRRRYYGSDVAALSDNVNRKRACVVCGTVRKSKAAVCRPCYQEARASTYLDLPCAQCDTDFRIMRAERDKRARKGQERFFCQSACFHQWMREHPSGTCGHCKGPMKLDGRRRRYCSLGCRTAVRDARRLSKVRPCPQCGVEYVPRSSRQMYCDRVCADQAHSERMVGLGNSHYKDGTSYAEWFRQMRPLILERDGDQCRACGTSNRRVPTGRSDAFQWKSLLVIHHLNELPADNGPENLITLCSPCHMRHHKSATTPFTWFESYTEQATRSMTSKWTETVTSLRMKFSSTTA